MSFGRLAVQALAEPFEIFLVAAVDDNVLEVRQHLADREDLALRLPAAAEHAQGRRPFPRQVLRRHGARGAGAKLPELVRLDHGCDFTPHEIEEAYNERRPALHPRVRLDAREPQLPVDGRHRRERTAVCVLAYTRPVLELTPRKP